MLTTTPSTTILTWVDRAQLDAEAAEARRPRTADTGLFEIAVSPKLLRYSTSPRIPDLIPVLRDNRVCFPEDRFAQVEAAVRAYRVRFALPMWRWVQANCASFCRPALRLGPIEGFLGGMGIITCRLNPVTEFADRGEAAMFRLSYC
jgi:hypothetical protein